MRSALASVVLLPLLAAAGRAADGVSGEVVDLWTVSGVRARFGFKEALLGDLGLRISGADAPDAKGLRTVDLQGRGRLAATAPQGVFGTLSGGEAVFENAPTLAWAGGF